MSFSLWAHKRTVQVPRHPLNVRLGIAWCRLVQLQDLAVTQPLARMCHVSCDVLYVSRDPATAQVHTRILGIMIKEGDTIKLECKGAVHT